MALVACTECGKEISDKAASCPHCGAPAAMPAQPPAAQPASFGKLFLIAIGALIGLMFLAAMCTSDPPKSGGQGSSDSGYWDRFAAEKKEECLRKRYPVPKGMSAETFCTAYGQTQAICKHDGKTGGVCE